MTFETLIQQPESLRDGNWESQFLDGILAAKVEVESPDPKPGPDGWPYLRVRTGHENATEPFSRVIKWVGSEGTGLVVNPHKMVPDYVFTYGMIWNFMETGRFIVPQPEARPGPVEVGPQTVMGAPTERYLPRYVRAIIREFLAAQGFSQPQVLVLSSPDYKNIDLAFALESLGGANSPQQQRQLAEALGWFLPLHYNLVLASVEGLPPFHPL